MYKRSRSSPPSERMNSTNLSVRKKRTASGSPNMDTPRQFGNGASVFKVIGQKDGNEEKKHKRSNHLMVINTATFHTGGKREYGGAQTLKPIQEESSNSRVTHNQPMHSHQQAQPHPKPKLRNIPPPTTYKRAPYKLFPYQDVLSKPSQIVNKGQKNMSRELDTPAPIQYSPYYGERFTNFSKPKPIQEVTYNYNHARRYAFLSNFSEPKSATVLFQSNSPEFNPSRITFRSKTASYLSMAKLPVAPDGKPQTETLRSLSVNTDSETFSIRPVPDSNVESEQSEDEEDTQRSALLAMRQWEYTTLGRMMGDGMKNPDHLSGGGTRFTLLNYNILAQTYLEEHQHLYKCCPPEVLVWPERVRMLLEEVDEYVPDVICFQEVEQEEFHKTFVPALDHGGYRGVYKKRTRDKPDGCAIFWNNSLFKLADKLGVEFYQPHIPLLDRDNIALMVRLEPRNRPGGNLVVCTTHLLFNPKRIDVKLAQTQLLLAELDRFAFSGYGRFGESMYYPLLLCGDFNSEPYGSIISFLTDGSLAHVDDNGYSSKFLQKRAVSEFLPLYAGISDQCVHYKIQFERFNLWKSTRKNRFDLDKKTKQDLINLNCELKPIAPLQTATSRPSVEEEDDAISYASSKYPETESHLTTEIEWPTHERIMNELLKSGLNCTFGTGNLTHDLKLRNVYAPKLDRTENNDNLATTKQGAWTCADFIFTGMQRNHQENRLVEGNLKLIRRLGLLSRNQAREFGSIPNKATPSDHYPLVAEFLLK